MNNKTIVVIPARGGSKRLPKKNSLLLNELPLIVHSINYAKQNSNLIDKIVVSTDCNEIKAIAMQNDVQVISRPKHISGDEATTVSALKHVLETLSEDFENVILLQPTNPLRPKKLLAEALNIFNKNDFDSLMTVTRNHQKLGKIVNKKFTPFNYKIGQRSQDLEPLYFENGLLYITNAKLILEGKILGENNHPMLIDHPFAHIDIDTQEDFDLAEFYYQKF